MDKTMTLEEIVSELRPGMTVGIGGWGSRRKPMALVREILRSSVDDLTLVAYGGPEVGMLAAERRLRRVVCGFVSLDSIPLDPHFRRLREQGGLEVLDLDEAVFMLGLLAAAWRVPFLPTRAGLGTDLLTVTDELRTVTSPYEDGETLVAAKALELDVALLHVHAADRSGNVLIDGVEPFFDPLFAEAASHTYVTCERLLAPIERHAQVAERRTTTISRLWVTGVCEVPGGAGFTSCEPLYGRDEEAQRAYVEAAADPGTWASYVRDMAAAAATPSAFPARTESGPCDR